MFWLIVIVIILTGGLALFLLPIVGVLYVIHLVMVFFGYHPTADARQKEQHTIEQPAPDQEAPKDSFNDESDHA